MASGSQPIPIGSLKHDPAWKHCQMFKDGDRVQLKCLYCLKVFSGGGIHRIKEHLACQKGNASCCPKVPADVRRAMLQSLEGVMVKKRKKKDTGQKDIRRILPNTNQINAFASLGVSVTSDDESRSRSSDRSKRGRVDSISPIMALNASECPSSSLVTVASTKDDHMHMAISRFLYDVGMPLDAVNSPYFEPMISAIVSNGPGVEAPTYHDLRGWVLKKSVDYINGVLDRYKATWGRTGCSVLADEWTTETGRTLLNIFVYCHEGTVFLKSFDVSDTLHASDVLYELLRGVVEEIGASNVLQVITDGADYYMEAGKRLNETFHTLYWTPCAARSINLMLEDIRKVDWINANLENAKSITRFIYNHVTALNIMRRYTGGRDLVQPTITHAATDIITLKSMNYLKDNLQDMVNSQEWLECPLSKDAEGISIMDLILSQSFWLSCSSIIRLTDHLVEVLTSVGSAKRPSMGYILAGMHRVKEAIKNELTEKQAYEEYLNIIDIRWNQQLQHPLHEAGFFLNPSLYYSVEGHVRDTIPSGMLDCIERLVPDTNIQDKINKELISYKNAAGDFGRKMAIRAAHTLLPAEWWSTYGGGCPNLARLAIRILSQTCSASVYRLSSICLEQVHKTKNHLERRRICDLIFVQYNLRLQQVNLKKTKGSGTMDPISTDSNYLTEDWVSDKMECFEGRDSDWVAVDQLVENTMLLEPPSDDPRNFIAGVNYHRGSSGIKYDEDDLGRQ